MFHLFMSYLCEAEFSMIKSKDCVKIISEQEMP